jgi:hypothetical protein
LQHFEISFDGKKQCKIMVFGNFVRCPPPFFDLDGYIIEFSLIFAIIGCNLVIKSWILLGQNNLLKG